MILKLNATISTDGKMLSALEGLEAVLWDSDLVADDKLATARVHSGKAEFIFELEDAAGLDSPLEAYPDLYITVADASEGILYRSETLAGVDFHQTDPVSGDAQTTLDLVFKEKK